MSAIIQCHKRVRARARASPHVRLITFLLRSSAITLGKGSLLSNRAGAKM